MEFIKTIPAVLVNFVLVTVFSLLIGLSQHKLHADSAQSEKTFGTDRTFTFIGILGFILYLINPGNITLFLAGALILSAFMGINYYFKITLHKDHGITTVVIALITYCLGPLLSTQPLWMVILIVVIVLVLTELKESLSLISQKFNKDEFLTLGKFLVIAGVILPIVPDEPVIQGLSLSMYKIWLAVVVVSSISYLSYLLKKFVFKRASIVISGILGGLYSSTATTIILAKKSRVNFQARNQYTAAIIFATAMMYLRILILILIFNLDLFRAIYPYFIVLFLVSIAIGLFVLFFRNKEYPTVQAETGDDKNPLEFRVALIFTALYVAFTFITYFVVKEYGTPGLNILSFIVGLTDIDPFLINLFQGKYAVPLDAVLLATLQAIISNNVLKMSYACFFSGKKMWSYIIVTFLLIIIINTVILFIV
jgi:uncharacterized membrane protein (DUF4010 family)